MFDKRDSTVLVFLDSRFTSAQQQFHYSWLSEHNLKAHNKLLSPITEVTEKQQQRKMKAIRKHDTQ